MPSHKALVFTGPAEPFKLIERPTPKPGPGQVLVKNVAVALNPADYVIHNIGAWVDHYGYPALIGLDGAGEVAAVGEGVVNVNLGDRVLYQSLFHPDTLTAQEYTLADAVQVARVPQKLSFDEAATIPLGFSTAAVGLYQEVKRRGGLALTAPWEEGGVQKYAGKPVIVAGGASSVGQYALQLLKLSGFSPIIATASKHNEAYVKAAGATHVIDYHDVSYADLPAAVKMITAESVSVVYDASGSPDAQKALWNILAPNGKIVTVGPLAVGKDGEVAEDGKLAAWVWGAANTPYNYDFGRKMYPALAKLLETGDIKPNNVEIIPNGLAGIPDALTRLALHKVSAAKLVARVAETAGEVGGAGLKDAVGAFFVQNRSLIAEVGCLPDPF